MRTVAFLIIFALVTGFSHVGLADDSDFEKNAEAQWNKSAAASSDGYANHEKRELQSWQDFKNRIKQKWADGTIPDRKTYVNYSANDTARVKVDYEHGTVTAEALLDLRGQDDQARKKVQSALSGLITSGDSPDAILTQDEIGSVSIANAAITEEPSLAEDSKPRTLYRMTLQLVPDFIKRRAQKIKPLVDQWASKYHLDSAYVLAIIRQESSFNPRARSWVPAIGLMQIVPQYAGQEVLKAVTGKATIPDAEFLYDPAKNIMVGTTYLQLLRDQYFPTVQDKAKQMYLSTAAFNWGPHRIQKLIVQGRIPASADSATTFDAIQRFAPDETKDYVSKVSQYYIEFKKEGL